MNKLKITAVAISHVIFGVSCNKDHNNQYESSTQGQARPVIVQELKETLEPIPIEASGILGSKAEVTLSFKIGGIVESIKVEEGQSVRKGQLLATLNMAEINAQVTQARKAVEKAERDLLRAKNLHRDSVITLEQLQDLTTLFEVAKADLEIATFNQQYSRIVALENGKVLKRFVEVGELVNPGSPIFTLGNTAKDAFVIRIGVSDRDIVRLQYADSAQVRFDAYPNRSLKANVSEIAQSADPLTGAFEVELTLSPSSLLLKNGFVGKVDIFPTHQVSYYRISMNALVEGERETAQVFLLDSRTNTAKKVQVRPEHIGDGFFTVLASDLQGAQVITDGAAYLSNGDKVQIVN